MTIKRVLTISTASSRFAKTWKATDITWESLCKKLKNFTTTPETMEEYRKSNKATQDNIKDVGGFVGGKLKNGVRSSTTVEYRSVVTLDADYAKAGFWDNLTCLNEFACAMYSTHKHCERAPRYRVVIPLTRDVTPEEYGAVSRMLAKQLGIDLFDDSTYQPSRLMYWPSRSCDAEAVYKEQGGDWVDPDSILALYEDWSNVAEWPCSSRVERIIHKQTKKVGDPTEKSGLIGAFCRVYSIESAIDTFLSDVYRPCSANRYTYINGSTAGGLVVYDGLYAYSNHATDPCSMQLCNAWDLVRIHLFGEQDANVDPSTPINKRPSSVAMSHLALNSPEVRSDMTMHQVEGAQSDFAEKPTSDATQDENTEWMSQLQYSDGGKILSTVDNFRLIIMNDPNLASIKGLDDFSGQYVVSGKLPWDSASGERFWTDTDDAGVRWYIERVYNLSGKDKCYDAISTVFKERHFHPVRDYLDSLEWDGTPRLDTAVIDYLGAADTDFNRSATRKSIVAAVARIYSPGCKYDYVPVLVGRQGRMKSTFLRKLGGKWFSDTLTSITGKEAYEELNGVWILEIGELSATRKAEVEATKHFLSKQVDNYRPAYGRRTVAHPRQCVFFGTTNSHEFLRDATGGRRFWPICIDQQPPKHSVVDMTQDIVDQIMAEAVYRYNDGERLYMDTTELDAAATEQQKAHAEDNVKTGLIEDYLDMLLPENWAGMNVYDRRMFISGSLDSSVVGTVRRKTVCAAEILCERFGMDVSRISKADTREINEILRSLPGWEWVDSPMRFSAMYGRQRGCRRLCENEK